MKLRNKKTGEIIEGLISAYGISGDIAVSVMDSNAESGYTDLGRYKTLAELNEEWEDYTPAEPLIKDEKVRKALRAWAEALEIECCMYDKCINAFAVGTVMINFPGKLRPETLQNGEIYKIDELCGKEEE